MNHEGEFASPHPWPPAALGGVDRAAGDDGVLGHLEVEHAEADEVGPALEGELEPILRRGRARGEHLERDPGRLHVLHELDRPWLAYKVLAAGAIPPKAGFRYAFENGADFCVVGMFDFQVAEDAAIASQVVKETEHRVRAWMA